VVLPGVRACGAALVVHSLARSGVGRSEFDWQLKGAKCPAATRTGEQSAREQVNTQTETSKDNTTAGQPCTHSLQAGTDAGDRLGAPSAGRLCLLESNISA
jgi:hypothetical protein